MFIVNAPLAFDRRSSGYVSLGTIETNVPTQYWPLSTSVIVLPTIIEAAQQLVKITQVKLRETAASGTTKKNDILLYFYNVVGATPPTLGAVYNAATTNHVATVAIAGADYKRLSATVDEAYVYPNAEFKSLSDATSVNLYCIAVFNEAGAGAQYAASAVVEVDVTVELAQTDA